MHRAQTIHAIDISFSAVNEKTRSVVANNCLVPCRDWEVDARFEWASRTANRASVAREGELRLPAQRLPAKLGQCGRPTLDLPDQPENLLGTPSFRTQPPKTLSNR
jgi:hypothetical protein